VCTIVHGPSHSTPIKPSASRRPPAPIGSLVVAAIAGLPVTAAVASYTKGFGDTAAGVGTLIALGAMFGKLLADSGGADQIVDTIIGRSSTRTLPWAMALVGALIGLPMFFEIGLVLLMPVIFLVARRSGLSLIKVGIPALAGLSVMHGLVPPHPGPLVAIAALNANLGITLAFGVLIALPTVAIAGPLFARYAARWVDVPAPHLFDDERGDGGSRRTGDEADGTSGGAGSAATTVDRRTVRRPTFAVTLATVLLAGRADDGQGARRHLHPGQGQPPPQRPRLPRHPADRPAAGRARRHLHPR